MNPTLMLLSLVVLAVCCTITFVWTRSVQRRKFELLEMSVAQENYDEGLAEGGKATSFAEVTLGQGHTLPNVLGIDMKRAIDICEWLKDEYVKTLVDVQTMKDLAIKVLRSNSFTVAEKIFLIEQLGTVSVVANISTHDFRKAKQGIIGMVAQEYGPLKATELLIKDLSTIDPKDMKEIMDSLKEEDEERMNMDRIIDTEGGTLRVQKIDLSNLSPEERDKVLEEHGVKEDFYKHQAEAEKKEVATPVSSDKDSLVSNL
jgi:hypothetical protein